MTKETREELINAIETYNKAQAEEENKIDVYEAFDSLNDFSDETLKEAVSEILKRIND